MLTSNKRDNQYPFLAPCKKIELAAPLRWIKAGYIDLKQALLPSLGYGLIMAIMVMSMIFIARGHASGWMIVTLLCMFIFLAPLMCVGLYAISAQLERNQPVSIKRTMKACLKRYIGSEMVFVLALLVIFLIWGRATSMVSIFIPTTSDANLADIMTYVLAIASVSLIFLSIVFSASVFSLPMIMHRDVDTITAIVTSVNAVLRNKLVMAEWAVLITLVFVVGVLTFGLALIVLLPLIGHAVWHGYLESIDVSEFPRHAEGITSVPRRQSKE